VECLNQLLKSLCGHEVMLFARDSAIAEALVVDMASLSEIDPESRATSAEGVALRVRENDIVEPRRRPAPEQVYQKNQIEQYQPRHIPSLRQLPAAAFASLPACGNFDTRSIGQSNITGR
jgi:hypothetical protein